MSDTLNQVPNHVPEPTPPEAAPPSTGSRLVTVGILLAAVAMAAVWIRRDVSLSTSATTQTAEHKTKGAKIGSAAPELVLKDLNGQTVRLSDLKGKVVVVDFWATWCQPCTIMIPWLMDFQNRYKNQGLEVVGVAMDEEGLTAVKPYAEKAKMNYTIVLGNDDVADSWGGIFGLPTTFIIDRQGRIQSHEMGLVSRSVLEKDIRSLL